MKSGLGSLIGIVTLTLAALAATIIWGNPPQLGLDLRGGVEVVLRPADDAENLELANQEGNLERAAEIIRRRVDAIGVAEPDVTVQDTDIVVQLPGVDDQQRAVDLVGQTAELRFRPVLYQPILLGSLSSASQVYASGYPDGVDAGADARITELILNELNISAGDGASVTATVEDTGESVDDETGDDETGMDFLGTLVPGEESAAAPAQLAEDEDAPVEGPVLPADGEGGGIDIDALQQQIDPGSITLYRLEGINGGAGTDELFSGKITSAEDDIEDQSVVFTDGTYAYLLGPTFFTGAALESADAVLYNAWSISVTFKPGEQGLDLLNVAALTCFNQQVGCPTNQMATVLDRRVDSAVGFNAPVFTDDTIQITRGNIGFPEDEAKDTALVLDFGALPIEFEDPTSSGLVRSVSSTLGEGSLRAGVIAGLIGLALVALYMLWYYRALGMAALLSLVLSATMLYVVVSFLSSTRGLALTLAGIVGLVVSIGVSLDSNVVYFEHLKEDISNGQTLRSATDKAFPVAFKTVFWANLATLIGAVILFVWTVGSVKGFALILGIASILDLVATYFFMRPLVHWLAHREAVGSNPGLFGVGLSRKVAQS